MYSIFTLLNTPYKIFGNLWIKSLIDKVDLNKVDYIFIADTGLDSNTLKNLTSIHTKVHIIKTGISNGFTGVHSTEWRDIVTNKTKILNHIFYEYKKPIVMVDVDCMFLKDISHLIDTRFDLLACFRGWDHMHSPFLGSFVVLNTNTGSDFVDKWHKLQSTITTPNKESPALTKAVVKYTNALYHDNESNYNIGRIPETVVNCRNISEQTKDTVLVHFKSGGSVLDIEQRIKGSIEKSGFYEIAKKYLND